MEFITPLIPPHKPLNIPRTVFLIELNTLTQAVKILPKGAVEPVTIAFTTFTIVEYIAFNIESVYEGDYPNEYKTYKFTGCTIEIEEGIKI